MNETPNNDLNNDGHDDTTGQFVSGNQEAAISPEAPVEPEAQVDPDQVRANLVAAAEALLAASAAYATIPENSSFFLGDGYRMQFAGHSLLTLSVC